MIRRQPTPLVMTDLDVEDVRRLVAAQRAEMEERQKMLDKLRDATSNQDKDEELQRLLSLRGPEKVDPSQIATEVNVKAERELRLGLMGGA